VKIDVSSWAQPLSRADFQSYYSAQRIQPWRRLSVVLSILVLMGLAVAAFDLAVLPHIMEESFRLAVFVASTVVLPVIVAGIIWAPRNMMRNVRLWKVCRANGLTFQEQVQNTRLAGAPFASGRHSLTRPMISNKEATVGWHQINNDGNDNKVRIYRPFTFGAARLPRQVPHIVLKNRVSDVVLMPQLAGAVKLELEGDFSETFLLYCPTGYEIDALQIFTPDVMAACLDLAGDAEIELVGEWLFVYTRSAAPFKDPVKLFALFKVMGALESRFSNQVESYEDDRAVENGGMTPRRRLHFKSRSKASVAVGTVLLIAYGISLALRLFGS
jgi:hypothetical protein